ncbi:hypothetical protein ACOSQ2_014319 [Xanthoceras sorbifolium]
MATAHTIIDVQNGKLSMTVLGETVEYQQCLSITGVENSKTGLGVKQKVKQKKKPKPCSNKPPNLKPGFEEFGGFVKLHRQLLGWLNPKRRGLKKHERIACHAGDGVLDVH